MKRTYQRSQILYFHELTAEQQERAISLLDNQQAEDSTYVLWNNEVLPLYMFMRTDNGMFDGVYGQTAFSAYFIKINKTNECATVVYAHC
jgi:hypothetical protein